VASDTTNIFGTRTRKTTGPTRESRRGGMMAMGAFLIVLGILAMVAPKISGPGGLVFLGALLATGGVLELAVAMADRRPRRGLLDGQGLFSIAVGVVMMTQPRTGMAALSMLLAGFFFATGLFPAITALTERDPGWGWDVAFGVAAVLLGIATLIWGPIAASWLVATFVGIELVVRGATLFGAAIELERPPALTRP
jgi:uncharacterized membrane protein HdeD (DUF308 family)